VYTERSAGGATTMGGLVGLVGTRRVIVHSPLPFELPQVGVPSLAQ